MLEEWRDRHPISELLAGSRHFAQPEPVSDIVADNDLYLILARTIEREVIPRLLLNARQNADAGRDISRDVNAAQTCREVVAFCDIVLTGEFDACIACVEHRLAQGSTLSSTLLELFAPTARRLGELWETDECSFTEVTIALGRLQQLLRLFSEAYRKEPEVKKLGFQALLATIPTNQHVFGIYVVEELFRNAGWNVLALPSPDRNELIDAIRGEWFAVVGLSVSCDESAASVSSLIQELRAASLNQSIVVLVGGRYVAEHADEASCFGADLVGSDAEEAIQRSQKFLKSIGR